MREMANLSILEPVSLSFFYVVFGADSYGMIAFLVESSILNMISVAAAKYELPKYVLSEPTNLIRDNLTIYSKEIQRFIYNVNLVN